MLSIIIPVYNASECLSNLLSNLLKADINLIEVIIVNDGSIDTSQNIIESHIQKENATNIKLVNKSNGGVSSARNEGMRNVSPESKYICFFDSDDYIYLDVLNRFIKSELFNHENFDLFLFNFIRKTPKEEKIIQHGLDSSFLIQDEFKELYLKGFMQACWNKIYRRSVILDNGIAFDEKISMGEDFRFNMDFISSSSNSKFSSSNEILYKYNVFTLGSLSNKYNSNSFELYKFGIARVESFCSKKGIDYPELHNRYLIALKDRVSNLFKSDLSFAKSLALFKKDFKYVRSNAKLKFNKIQDKQSKLICLFVFLNLPSLLLSLLFSLLFMKSIIRGGK